MASENPNTNTNRGPEPPARPADPPAEVGDAEELEEIPFRRPSNRRRFQMRYTIIDAAGSVSFVGPCQGLKVLVAACAEGDPRTAEALLAQAGEYDNALRDQVLNGLRVFDEHNVPGNYAAIHALLAQTPDGKTPGAVFRVVDPLTRDASLTPQGAGLVLFNLKERRIIQVQNTYAEIRRENRGRVRRNGGATGRFYTYRLPAQWQILP